MKIKGSSVIALVNEDKEYTVEELRDTVEQLHRESLGDGDNFIVFRGNRYGVKKATYRTIRAAKGELIFKEYVRMLLGEMLGGPSGPAARRSVRWYLYVPFIPSIIESIRDRRRAASWMRLVHLTFESDHEDFNMWNLTPEEMQRVMQIFFRFQAELFRAQLAK